MHEIFDELQKQHDEAEKARTDESLLGDLGRGVGKAAKAGVNAVKSGIDNVKQGFSGPPTAYDDKFKARVIPVIQKALDTAVADLAKQGLIDPNRINTKALASSLAPKISDYLDGQKVFFAQAAPAPTSAPASTPPPLPPTAPAAPTPPVVPPAAPKAPTKLNLKPSPVPPIVPPVVPPVVPPTAPTAPVPDPEADAWEKELTKAPATGTGITKDGGKAGKPRTSVNTKAPVIPPAKAPLKATRSGGKPLPKVPPAAVPAPETTRSSAPKLNADLPPASKVADKAPVVASKIPLKQDAPTPEVPAPEAPKAPSPLIAKKVPMSTRAQEKLKKLQNS